MSRSGLSLIEALVAIALVATVLPVALAAVTDGSRAIATAHRGDVARRVADNRLARLLLDDSWTTSAASGDCDPEIDGEDATGLRWTLAVEAWRDPVVRRIHITVLWGDGPRGGSVSAETLAVPGATP